MAREPCQDERLVAAAAAKLDVDDFGVFLAAYRYWWGHDPARGELGRAFMNFLLEQRAPNYVRSYCYRVLSDDPPPPPPRFITPRGPETVYLLAIFTAATLFYLLFLA